MRWISLLGVVCLLAISSLWAGGAAQSNANAVAGTNLLVNPGFEGDFTVREAPEIVMAEGWTAWYREGERRPEFKPEWIDLPSIRVLHGDYGQKFFTLFGSHDAGFYQQASVPAGSPLMFSIWVQVWSSDCDDICVSPLEPCHPHMNENSHGNYRVSVGIDPYGGTDPLAENVVWNQYEPAGHYDQWAQLTVRTTAQSDTVTVFTRGNPQWDVKHNDSYWDEAALKVVDEASPTPTDTPTTATATPSPTMRASSTPTTAATSTSTPTTPSCQQLIANPDFESAGEWQMGMTRQPPARSTAQAHSPTHAMRLGIAPPAADVETWSPTWQELTIPTDAVSTTLSFWYYPASEDTDNDWQEAIVRDANGLPLNYVMRLRGGEADARSWQFQEFDLTAFAGETIQTYFNVYNNGDGSGTTRMYVDDVEIVACPAGGASRAGGGLPRLAAPSPTAREGASGGQRTLLPFVAASLGPVDSPHEVGIIGLRVDFICDDLYNEYVQLKNFGGTVDMTGWTLQDENGNVYTFPTFTLEADARVRVWTKTAIGDGRPTDLYWGLDQATWDNDADRARLWDAEGRLVDSFEYSLGTRGFGTVRNGVLSATR